ncbi:MAG: hypothetical protein QXJ64_00430 [Thermosphaera sp.]
MLPNKLFFIPAVSEKRASKRIGSIYLLVLVVACLLHSAVAMGQRVEPLSVYRFKDVFLHEFNIFTRSFAAVSRDGTVLVVTSEGLRTGKIDPRGLKAIYVLEEDLLLQREDSLELYSLRGGSRTLCTCQGLSIRRVYSKFVLIDCGKPMLLDIFEGKTIALTFNARPLNTWKHIIMLDLDSFTIAVFTGKNWTSLSYSLTADIVFSMEGERGIYMILADKSVLLLNPETLFIKSLGNIKPSRPIGVVKVDGVEHLVLGDGTMISERGGVSALRAGLAFIVASQGYFALTDDGCLFFRERIEGSWFGPLLEFADSVLALIPATRYTDVPAVIVICMRGSDLEVLTVGFRDFNLVATLRTGLVYALERAEVSVEVDRSGGLSGVVVVGDGDRAIDSVRFDSTERRTLVSIQLRVPGCYDVYVEIAPQGYYPSKRVRVGQLCVQARPISCQLRALQREVEEGGEILLELRILDTLNGSDVTNDVLTMLPSLNVSHTLPDGRSESILRPPTDTLRLIVRGAGGHRFSVAVPPSGPYDKCVTDPVTVNVRAATNVLLIVTTISSIILGGIAGVFYVRMKTNVWRGIERAISAGTSCDELTEKLSGILPEQVVRAACEFVNLCRVISSSVDGMLSALRPLYSVTGVREMMHFLESSGEEISACRSIYLKGDPESALKKLNALRIRLYDEMSNLATKLYSEKNKLEEERKKLNEYLSKLEQYKDRASARAYSRLRDEYETKLRRVIEEIDNIENALKTIAEATQLMYSG